jgi:hypothetical protein
MAILIFRHSGTGPCGPGLDLLAALYGCVSFILLILYTIFKLISKGSEYVFSLFTNLAALAIFVLICNL